MITKKGLYEHIKGFSLLELDVFLDEVEELVSLRKDVVIQKRLERCVKAEEETN